MKKAIVNGAAGFAGYSLTIHLLEHGYDVYAVIRPDSIHAERLTVGAILSSSKKMVDRSFFDSAEMLNLTEGLIREHLHLVYCSGRDILSLTDTLEGPFDLFYHLVWAGGRNDYDAQYDNIAMTLDALRAAMKLSCRRIICTGSQAEYGPTLSVITENTFPMPNTAYGAAKLSALYLSKSLASHLGIEWIWGRLFSLYGLYEPSGRLYPDMTEKFRKNELLSLSDCTQNWEYLDVEDAAEALIALGERGHNGEIYNISTGEPRPLKFYVEQLKAELRSASEINYGAPADPYVSLQTDISKIHEHTGWKPQISFHTFL